MVKDPHEEQVSSAESLPTLALFARYRVIGWPESGDYDPELGSIARRRAQLGVFGAQAYA